MKDFIKSIYKSVESGNYHAALFTALSLPDICGKLETPEVRRNGVRSKRWFEENLRSKYFPDTCYEHCIATNPDAAQAMHAEQLEHLKSMPFTCKFSPTDFWAFRNAFLHSADDNADGLKIHITHGDSHQCMLNGALQLSAKRLCLDIANAASEWLIRVEHDEAIRERINSRATIKNSLYDGAFIFN